MSRIAACGPETAHLEKLARHCPHPRAHMHCSRAWHDSKSAASMMSRQPWSSSIESDGRAWYDTLQSRESLPTHLSTISASDFQWLTLDCPRLRFSFSLSFRS